MHNSCVIKNVLHTHSQYGEIVDLFTCRLHILRSFITIDYYEIKESKSGNIKSVYHYGTCDLGMFTQTQILS